MQFFAHEIKLNIATNCFEEGNIEIAFGRVIATLRFVFYCYIPKSEIESIRNEVNFLVYIIITSCKCTG